MRLTITLAMMMLAASACKPAAKFGGNSTQPKASAKPIASKAVTAAVKPKSATPAAVAVNNAASSAIKVVAPAAQTPAAPVATAPTIDFGANNIAQPAPIIDYGSNNYAQPLPVVDYGSNNYAQPAPYVDYGANSMQQPAPPPPPPSAPQFSVRLYADCSFSPSSPFTDSLGRLNCSDKDQPGCKASYDAGTPLTLYAPATLTAPCHGRCQVGAGWICTDDVDGVSRPSGQNLCPQNGTSTCSGTVSRNIVCSAAYQCDY